MAGYTARSDQLWYFALQLAEEETNSFTFTQHEGDIIAKMFEKEKLTLKEFGQIQHLQPTPIRANEELLSIIARKPRDVYECFLSLVKETNQPHLYQMLVSGDNSCDEAKREDPLNHKDLICWNFTWLSENLDTENGLITLLFQRKVLTSREKEDVVCVNNIFQKNELLLGLLIKKSPKDFELFLEGLTDTGQDHLAKRLRKPEGSYVGPARDSTSVSTPKIVRHELSSKVPHESEKEPVPISPFSAPKYSQNTLPKSWQKPIPSRSSLKPLIPPKPSLTDSAKRLAMSMHKAAKTTKKTVNHIRKRNEGVTFQSRLKELEAHLKTDIAIRVTSVSQLCSNKSEESQKMCLRILLQECHQMRKDIFSRNEETNVELEQLRKSASQYSVISTLNEVFRTQLHSTQQELTRERSQNNKERMKLEENINILKTEIKLEETKCRRLEEEKLSANNLIAKMKSGLNEAERDKQHYQQQFHELNIRLTSAENEFQKSKKFFEEFSNETILLRTEREPLREECETLREVNKTVNDLEAKLHQTQSDIRDLHTKLKEMESNLEFVEDEKLDLIKSQKDSVDGKSMENDRVLKLRSELDSEKHLMDELEDKLKSAISRLEATDTIFVSKESYILRSNHQFLVENMKPSRFIDLLHENDCIRSEERNHLNKQPYNFYTNDALLQWMRTISLKQDKVQRVLDCFRQSDQDFVADVLEKGGVLIKSKISMKLAKKFTKSPSKNVEGSKERLVLIIEKLNQMRGFPLSGNQSATTEIKDCDIVIAPYCQQEAEGIVIWFWCQSKYGQTELQIMYESGILLKRLRAIFKECLNDRVSSPPKMYVLTGVTIFEGDFTKAGNGLPEKYQSDPVLIETIRAKTAEEGKKSVFGMTILDKELFILSEQSSEIDIYDSTELSFIRRLTMKELIHPRDIRSCNRNKCLYLLDCKDILGQSNEILKVDPNGKLIKNWSTGDDYGWGLSVTDESNVVLTVYSKNKLNEYSSDGQLIREISLPSEAGIRCSWHAVKLANGSFMISYDLNRVCIVDEDGKLMKSFRGNPGNNIGEMYCPFHLSVDGNGFVMVADRNSSKVLLLDSDLEFKREILSREKQNKLRIPTRILLDETNGRLFVADCEFLHDGRILIFKFCV